MRNSPGAPQLVVCRRTPFEKGSAQYHPEVRESGPIGACAAAPA